MNAKIRSIVLVAGLLVLGGCYPYYPYPYSGAPPGGGPAATSDRAWAAAMGAMQDQGVQIGSQDRSTGTIDGRRGNVTVRTRLVTQADGRTRVEFNMGGAISEDPGLPDRISRAYEARMGR